MKIQGWHLLRLMNMVKGQYILLWVLIQNLNSIKKILNHIKNSEILHITGMYIEVVEEASKHANLLSFNPGTLLSSYGMESLEKILKRTHILFLNKKEVTLLNRYGL